MSFLLHTPNERRLFLNGIASSSTGSKSYNEDAVGLSLSAHSKRVVIADGHWGESSSLETAKFWLEQSNFPTNKNFALQEVKKLESAIYNQNHVPQFSPLVDQPSEAAFIAAELNGETLRYVSYGDCRLIVVRDSALVIRNVIRQTWLGSFSHLGLRGRLPLESALEFRQYTLHKDDVVMIFSDGVDECIYGVPTLSDEFFVESAQLRYPEIIHDCIIKEVWKHGAEDNVSLAVLKV